MIIDPHVHLRDWEQKAKETMLHGMESALLCGVGALFDMPNCAPSLTDEKAIRRRLEDGQLAAKKLSEATGSEPMFYGIYGGLTCEERQVRELVRLHHELFPAMVGMKLFAGRSTGNLAVLAREDQRRIWRLLAEEHYRGVVAVHCEKEDFFLEEMWNPEIAASHSLARPEKAETESVKDQLSFARESGFPGNLHICHISSRGALEEVRRAKAEAAAGRLGFTVSCGATHHHLLLDTSLIPDGPEGLLFKVNPPIRGKAGRRELLSALFDGTVDWIESDHAPHQEDDKYRHYASGIPSLTAWPCLLARLRFMKMPESQLRALVCGRVLEVFGLDPSLVPDLPFPSGDSGLHRDLISRYPANCWSALDLLPPDDTE
jgi:dihydroorotase